MAILEDYRPYNITQKAWDWASENKDRLTLLYYITAGIECLTLIDYVDENGNYIDYMSFYQRIVDWHNGVTNECPMPEWGCPDDRTVAALIEAAIILLEGRWETKSIAHIKTDMPVLMECYYYALSKKLEREIRDDHSTGYVEDIFSEPIEPSNWP